MRNKSPTSPFLKQHFKSLWQTWECPRNQSELVLKAAENADDHCRKTGSGSRNKFRITLGVVKSYIRTMQMIFQQPFQFADNMAPLAVCKIGIWESWVCFPRVWIFGQDPPSHSRCGHTVTQVWVPVCQSPARTNEIDVRKGKTPWRIMLKGINTKGNEVKL